MARIEGGWREIGLRQRGFIGAVVYAVSRLSGMVPIL